MTPEGLPPESSSILPRISDYIAQAAANTPDAEAAILGDQRLSYRGLAAQIDDCAKALVAAGIRKGDRVATLQTPSPQFAVEFLASASIGAIWVGLNPRYRLEELRHVVTDAAPTILIARTHIGGRDYRGDLLALREAARSICHLVVHEEKPELQDSIVYGRFRATGAATDDATLDAARASCGGRDPCLIVYTSGSTGPPKGALLHHQGIAAFALEQNRLWPAEPLRMLNYFPINHVGCVIDVTMPTLIGGGTVVFLEQFDTARSLDLLYREQITVWGSVPSVFAMQLASREFDPAKLQAVQLILWEGAAMPEPMVRRLLEICPRLATNYGMTETTSAITIVTPTDEVDVLARSVGHAFPGVEIRLASPNGTEAPLGEVGELQARSPYNLLGYWGRPEATAEAFTDDGFFRTGDLATRRPDGRYRLAGRLKEMFKSGGYNVYPREIESVLETYPGVALAAVVAAEDPLWGEVGIAYLVPQANSLLDIAAVEEWCRERLANFKVPKRFLIEPEPPLLPIGKIDKVELKRRAGKLVPQ